MNEYHVTRFYGPRCILAYLIFFCKLANSSRSYAQNERAHFISVHSIQHLSTADTDTLDKCSGGSIVSARSLARLFLFQMAH